MGESSTSFPFDGLVEVLVLPISWVCGSVDADVYSDGDRAVVDLHHPRSVVQEPEPVSPRYRGRVREVSGRCRSHVSTMNRDRTSERRLEGVARGVAGRARREGGALSDPS